MTFRIKETSTIRVSDNEGFDLGKIREIIKIYEYLKIVNPELAIFLRKHIITEAKKMHTEAKDFQNMLKL